jgi:CPA2 family monovalent cation:H+ antiporter-2
LFISGLFGVAFQLLGFVTDWIFMTLIISTISLSIVVPILKDKGISNTPYGQTILLTAVISDFATMILLAIYVALHADNIAKPFLLLILFIVVFFFYRFLAQFKTGRIIQRISRETVQLGTRGVFALILFLVVLSEEIGAESILGAFLAGVLVSLLSPRKEFVHQLNSFGFGFLIPIFFFMVGATLELRGLFQDMNALLLLPLILCSFYVSKFVPILLWRRWFPWNRTLAAGYLLPSTLSLVIAGTAIGMELGVIDNKAKAALILAAVLSCVLSPILFQRAAPPKEPDEDQKRISLIGANTINLALAKQLHQDGYDVTIYTADESLNEKERTHSFRTVVLPEVTPGQLANHDVAESDFVVALTRDEALNIQIANWAKLGGCEQVICRMDNEEKSHELVDGVNVFSTLISNRILLQALIEYPSIVKLLQVDQSLREVEVTNDQLHNRLIKDLSFLGDALIIRVVRKINLIVPHGSTRIKVGDTLLISGDQDMIQSIRREVSIP